MTSTLAGKVTIAGYNVACPKCHEYIQSPNSLIGMCLWTETELRDYPRAWCPKCKRAFAVGTPGEDSR